VSWTPLPLTDFDFISRGTSHNFAMAAEVSHAHEHTFTVCVCVNAQSSKTDFFKSCFAAEFLPWRLPTLLQRKEREGGKGREMNFERAKKINEKQIRKKGTKKMNSPMFRKRYTN
jgi:hypothetical protein